MLTGAELREEFGRDSLDSVRPWGRAQENKHLYWAA